MPELPSSPAHPGHVPSVPGHPSGRADFGQGHSGKADFGQGQPSPGQPEVYRGAERRRAGDRRQGVTRREQFRFEPDKEDRRSGKDRRAHGGWDRMLLR